MPKTSIIITSYNQKNYLVETIDSVLAQTVKPFEILVADDASTDGSVELIQGYEARYPGLVKGIYNPQNVGISENRNSALRKATGEYVAVQDGDDRYLPTNLEKQLWALDQYPAAKCVYSNLYFIDSQGERFRIRDTEPCPNGSIFTFIAAGKMGLLRSMLAPRHLVEEAGYLDPKFPKHDGLILSLRLAKLVEYAYVFEPLAEYRVHDRGDSKQFSHQERWHYLQNVYLEISRMSQSLPAQDQEIIHTTWQRRLFRWQVSAKRQDSGKLSAILFAAAGVLKQPACFQDLPAVFRG